MGTEKIKPELNGVAETMLLTFYARAQYSKSKKHAFYDIKAVELVECLYYNFSNASKDVAMGGGTIARTLVFDELVRDFLQKHPDAVAVNILRGKVQLYPIYRLASWMPIVRKMAEKILVFQKKSSS